MPEASSVRNAKHTLKKLTDKRGKKAHFIETSMGKKRTSMGKKSPFLILALERETAGHMVRRAGCVHVWILEG